MHDPLGLGLMRIWRWEEFSKCDKFSTTPDYHRAIDAAAGIGAILRRTDGRMDGWSTRRWNLSGLPVRRRLPTFEHVVVAVF